MKRDFYIVGIGASAGALPVMIDFFKQIPANTNAAFVVISHLMRDRRSHLDTILSSHANLPVVRVESDMAINASCIYVMAENTYLTSEYNVLRVQDRSAGIKNEAVDIFLASLAADAGDSSVAIILSGGGSDGLNAAKAIHDAGGKVLVQAPDSAKCVGMPSAITNFDHPDRVVEPEDLARELLAIVGKRTDARFQL